eukprot:5575339-Prorocentrum_lima.AAC.1
MCRKTASNVSPFVQDRYRANSSCLTFLVGVESPNLMAVPFKEVRTTLKEGSTCELGGLAHCGP